MRNKITNADKRYENRERQWGQSAAEQRDKQRKNKAGPEQVLLACNNNIGHERKIRQGLKQVFRKKLPEREFCSYSAFSSGAASGISCVAVGTVFKISFVLSSSGGMSSPAAGIMFCSSSAEGDWTD